MSQSIDIYSPKGTKVKAIFDNEGQPINGLDYDKEKVLTYLKPELIYTIDHTEVSNWRTEVYLQEVPSVPFNSVCFTYAEHLLISIGDTKQVREILFRGIRINNGQWIMGDLIQSQRGDMSILPIWEVDLTENVLVNPATVGQYFGIDKNGNRIFEDDFVKVGDKIMPVIFDNGCFYTLVGDNKYRLGGWKTETIEVVGNIFNERKG